MMVASAVAASLPAGAAHRTSARVSIPRADGLRVGRGDVPRCSSRPSRRQGRQGVAVRAEAERKPWDFGRFVNTLVFFNEPPPPQEILKNLVMAPFNILKAVTGGDLEDKKNVAITILAPNISGDAPTVAASNGLFGGVVLVTGATGGVGKRVVELLLKRGVRVRALVRDVDKAKELFGSPTSGVLEIAGADVTQKQTLLPEYFEGVRAVVNCCAVKVQPKEGDTVDRAKYMQGIKFYDPEIASDTPEAVELEGLSNILELVKASVGVRDGRTVFSVGAGGVQGTEWGPLDDVVMGGVSKSAMRIDKAAGVDGGLSIRMKGNGNRLKIILRTDTNWDGIAYCLSVDTSGEWETIRMPFADFFPMFRAKKSPDSPALDPSSIRSIQIMCSKFEYDGDLNPSFTPGPFEMPIESITAYMQPEGGARFVQLGSAGSTRWNRPGIDVAMEPPAVGMNDALGGILTYKLAGEDAVRSSGIPFAVVRPAALTEEPRGMELEFQQGDVLKGKVSRDDIAELCVACLERPEVVDTTFEVKSTVPFSQPWTIDEANPPPARDWSAELGKAGLRKGVTGKTINGVYTGTEVEASA